MLTSALPCSGVHEWLRAAGVDFFTGVPDSVLKSYCAFLSEVEGPTRHVIALNEGGALSLAVGHYLATGGLPLVYLQNSGIGNLVNPAISLAHSSVYGIPMLLLVGWRGRPGATDEPQHLFQGLVTEALLRDLGIECVVLPGDRAAAEDSVKRAARRARHVNSPVAILVETGRFALHAAAVPEVSYAMTREDALRQIVGALDDDDIVVATTGHLSRELFDLRAAAGFAPGHDFLNVGAMGHASQIALGISLARPERRVICLDGDGAALMHLGGCAMNGSLAPRTFRHVVFNNGAHDSVGGQPTLGFRVDFVAIARACNYAVTWRAVSAAELEEGCRRFLDGPGPAFLEVRVACGSRRDLGRPTQCCQDAKRVFMARVSP